MHPIRTLFRQFEWIHVGLGLIGNASFAIGSVFFLSEETRQVGVWLFIVGSFGMLIGSIGSAIVKGVRDGG